MPPSPPFLAGMLGWKRFALHHPAWMGFSKDAGKAPAPSNYSSNPQITRLLLQLGNRPHGRTAAGSTSRLQTTSLRSSPLFLYPKARGCRLPPGHLKLTLLPTLVLKGHLQTPAPSLPHMEPVFFFLPPVFASIKRAFSSNCGRLTKQFTSLRNNNLSSSLFTTPPICVSPSGFTSRNPTSSLAQRLQRERCRPPKPPSQTPTTT